MSKDQILKDLNKRKRNRSRVRIQKRFIMLKLSHREFKQLDEALEFLLFGEEAAMFLHLNRFYVKLKKYYQGELEQSFRISSKQASL